MTRTEAFKTLTAKTPAGIGLTRKMAEFLLADAEKLGTGAHLKCDVTYTPAAGFAIVNYQA